MSAKLEPAEQSFDLVAFFVKRVLFVKRVIIVPSCEWPCRSAGSIDDDISRGAATRASERVGFETIAEGPADSAISESALKSNSPKAARCDR
jgi:hypothetical protein